MRLSMEFQFVLLLAACATVTASSVITAQLNRFTRTGTYSSILDADHSRAAFLKNGTVNVPESVAAINLGSLYVTPIGIGQPPTYYNLVVDTGSSVTFCGIGTRYIRTSTSISTGEAINNTYGTADFYGKQYLDQVTLAPNLVITNQSIGDALESHGLDGLNGILGLGPRDLTRHTLSPDRNATFPTVMENLVSQGLIEKQVLGIYFAPMVGGNVTINGALTYGGIDSSLYDGELTYTPVTSTLPASRFWGINITSVTHGNQTVISNDTAGIVDTGTSLILLAKNFFDAYASAIPGAEFDPKLKLLAIPQASIQYMQPLIIVISDREFTLDVNSQLFPVDDIAVTSRSNGTRFSVFGSLPWEIRGLGFILGQKFLERFYTVFDADENRVGFAETNNTFTSC